MKKFFTLIIPVLIVFISIFGIIQKAEAKWWIFGNSGDDVSFSYLYLNNNSYDELGNKVLLYKDSLKNNMITINGKVSVKNGKVGYVKISNDGKQTWEKAKTSDNGSFEYNFTPEIDKPYQIYIKASDTTGIVNKVDETFREVTVSNKSIDGTVRETFNNFIKAYENQEPTLFMSYISPNFAGGDAVLDSAIRKDFSSFDFIKINYVLNNISSSSDGKVSVSVSYTRTVVSRKSGKTFSDNGNTELVLKNENNKFKILSMKNPLLFGLSDAANVATGTIRSATNNPIVLVDSSGNVSVKPFKTAMDIIENNSNNNVSNTDFSTATLTYASPGFIFSSGSNTIGRNSDISLEYNIIITDDSGAHAQKLDGYSSIDSVHEVPATGYNEYIMNLNANVGSIYALTLGNGKYALMQITGYADHGNHNSTLSFKYKYQPDGSRNF